jgi:hypothetical protein
MYLLRQNTHAHPRTCRQHVRHTANVSAKANTRVNTVKRPTPQRRGKLGNRHFGRSCKPGQAYFEATRGHVSRAFSATANVLVTKQSSDRERFV